MLKKIKEKILNSSDSFLFFKNEYYKLLKENSDLRRRNIIILSENKRLKSLLENILKNQDEIKYLLNDTISLNQTQKNILDNITVNQNELNNKLENKSKSILENISSNQQNISNNLQNNNKTVLDNLSLNQTNLINNLQTHNNEILDTISKNQDITVKQFNDINKELSSINEIGLRIEKSSSYTNIKINSKFAQNKRYMENQFQDLENTLKEDIKNANNIEPSISVKLDEEKVISSSKKNEE